MFTSNSEFDANRRVCITNETVPMNIYAGLHSVLRNDMWKWFLGYSETDENLDYTSTPSADDSTTFAKVVNGTVASDYGPVPQKVYDSGTGAYKTVNPTYHSLKVDGAFMPEIDLFLHEIYRYLDCLYPDHPDWRKLLTKNEINDAFQSAAAMVDYKINTKFLDLVIDSINETMSSDDTEAEQLKIKLRDLKDEAFRRKMYGTRLGYRMFAGSFFAVPSIFRVGTYYPVKPVDSAGHDRAAETVDSYSKNYLRKFKLEDWTGSSLIKDSESIVYTNFWGNSIPGYDYQIFECPDKEKSLAYADDCSIGQLFANSDDSMTTTYIQAVSSDNENILKCSSDSSTGTEINTVSSYSSSKYANYLTTSHINGIIYKTGYLYNGFADAVGRMSDSEKLTLVSSGILNSEKMSGSYLLETIAKLPEATQLELFSTVEFVPDPFTRGLLLLRPDTALSMYGTEPSFSASGSSLSVGPDKIRDGFPVSEGQLVSTEILSGSSEYYLAAQSAAVYQVSGINKGSLDFTISTGSTANFTGARTAFRDARYAMSVKNSSGKYIVMYGRLSMTYETDDTTKLTYAKKGTFYITDIPDTKPDDIAASIYSEFSDSLSRYKVLQPLVKAGTASASEQTEFVSLAAYLDECRQNRSLVSVSRTRTLANGTEYSYCTLSFHVGCTVSGFYEKQFTDGTHSLENAMYNRIDSWFTAYTTNLSFGSISVVPYIDANSFVSPPVSSFVCPDGKSWHVRGSTVISIGGSDVSVATDTIDTSLFSTDRTSNLSSPAYAYIPDASATKFSAYSDTSNVSVWSKSLKTVSILGTSDITSDASVITFTGDTARSQMRTLSVGDSVYGFAVPDGTYITGIGDYTVTLSSSLTVSGEFLFNFKVSMYCLYNDISTDMTEYRNYLLNTGLLEKVNPFEHGLYGSKEWPYSSKAYIDGLCDPSFFSPWNSSQSFAAVMKALYQDSLEYSDAAKTKNSNKLVPSMVKFDSSVFLELNTDRLLKSENRAGTAPTLMNVEWLDYLDSSVDAVSRATDNINSGTQTMLETDMSGYYTFITNSAYTDANIRSLVQTFSWTTDTVPCYAQAGNAGSAYRSLFVSPENVTYPSIYGAAYYDDTMTYKLYNSYVAKGASITHRMVYETSGVGSGASANSILGHSKTSIDNPLFEIPLGEYDIQKDYAYGRSTMTTVQMNFYKQAFSNIIKSFSVKQHSNDFESYSIFTPITSQMVAAANDVKLFGDFSTFYTFKSMGVWTPATELDSSGRTVISYPSSGTETLNAQNSVIEYYVIKTGKAFSGVYNTANKETEEKTFSDLSILVYDPDSSRFIPYAFQFAGFYGDMSDAITQPDTVIPPDTTYSCFDRMTTKITYSLGGYGASDLGSLSAKTYADASTVAAGKAESYQRTIPFLFVRPGASGYNSITAIYADKSVAAFIYLKGSYIPVLLNTGCKFIASLPVNKLDTISSAEYQCAIEGNSKVSGYSTMSRLDGSYTSLALPRKFIGESNYNINFTYRPDFRSYGYLYTDGVPGGELKEFRITDSAIVYDSANECYYATSGENKYALHFNESKFFKNTLSVSGTYQNVKSIDSQGSIAYTPTLNLTSSLPYSISDISTEDRILKVSEVQLRSDWLKDYESTQFSSYVTLTGTLIGIDAGGHAIVSSELGYSNAGTAAKISMAADISGLMPAYISGSTKEMVPETTVGFPYTYSATGTEYAYPDIVSISAKNPIVAGFGETTSTIDDYEFKYYKNLLVTEGIVYKSSPNTIYVSNSAAANALKVSDSVVSAVGLTLTNETIRMGLYILDSAGQETAFTASDVCYSDGILAAGSDDGVFAMKSSPFSSMSSKLTFSTSVALSKESVLGIADSTKISVISMFRDRMSGDWYANIRVHADIPYTVLVVIDPTFSRIQKVSDGLGTDVTSTDAIEIYDYTSSVAQSLIMIKACDRSVSAGQSIDADTAQKNIAEGWYKTGSAGTLMTQNAAGYAAVLDGDVLFLRNKTRTVTKNSTTGLYEYTGASEMNHWKRGTMPSKVQNTRVRLDAMTTYDEYAFVAGLLKQAAAYYKGVTSDAGTVFSAIEAGIGNIMTPVSFSAYMAKNSYAFSLSGISVDSSGNVIAGAADGFKTFACTADTVESAYREYLYFIASSLLGYYSTESVLSDSASGIDIISGRVVITLSSGLVVSGDLSSLESKADIENADNWTISAMPAETEYSYVSASAPSYEVCNGSADKPVMLSPSIPCETGSAYTATLREKCGSLIFVGGHYHSITTFHTAYRSGRNVDSEGEVTDADELAKEQAVEAIIKNKYGSYPMLMYSADAGRTFSRIDIPDYNGIFSAGCGVASTATINYTAHLAVYNNVLYVTFRCGSSNCGYVMTVPVRPNGSLNTAGINFVSADSLDSVTSEIASSVKQSDCSAGTLYIKETGKTLTVASYFGLSIPSEPGNRIISSSGGKIGLRSPLFTAVSGSTDYISVLFAFRTAAQIRSQADYINLQKLDSYTGDGQSLLVPDAIEVPASDTADRIYSYRETLADLLADSNGYPAVSEDTSHIYYSYTTETDSSGSTIYSPVYLCNSEGEKLCCCTKDGTGLVCTAGYNDSSTVSAYGRLSSGISFDSLYVRQAVTPAFSTVAAMAESVSSLETDSALTGLLSGAQYINAMSIDTSNPYLSVNTGKTFLSFKDYLYSESDDNAAVLSDVIVKQSGEYGSLLNPYSSFSSRVSVKDGYYYDNMYGCYPLRLMKKIAVTVDVPYCRYGSAVSYQGEPFLTNSSHQLYLDSGEALSGIYIPENGYGGTRVNTSGWTSKSPWDIDPDAFSSRLAYNTIGKPVYLTDADGNALTESHGDRQLALSKSSGKYSLSISPADIDSTKKTVYYRSYDSGHALEYETSETFYNLPALAPRVYQSSETAYLSDGKVCAVLVFAKAGKSYTAGSFKCYYDSDTSVAKGFSFTEKNTSEGYCYYEMQPSAVEKGHTQLTVKAVSDGVSVSAAFSVKYSDSNEFCAVTGFVPVLYKNGKKLKDSPAAMLNLELPKGASSVKMSGSSVLNQSSSTADNKYTVESPDIYSAETVTVSSNGTDYVFSLPYIDTGTDTILINSTVTSAADGSAPDDILFAAVIDNVYDVTESQSITWNSAKKAYSISGTSIYSASVSSGRQSSIDFSGSGNTDFIFYAGKTPSGGTSIQRAVSYSGAGMLYAGNVTGNLIMRCPEYISLKSLVSALGTVIPGASDVFSYSGTALTTISSIKTSSLVFNSSLGDSLDDGAEHDVVIRLLPRVTVEPAVNRMNSSDSYCEISLADAESFGFDRIYFSENGYPASPYYYGNSVYNQDSLQYYGTDKYTNQSGAYVYQCDKDGKYVKAVVSDGVLSYETLGDSSGDLSDDIYGTTDNRLIPYAPKYSSCQTWFASSYYVSGIYKNPFWQVLQFSSRYNKKTSQFEQQYQISHYIKSDSSYSLDEVDESERVINVAKASVYDLYSDNVIVSYETDYLNRTDGTINFSLIAPASKYKTLDSFVQYGLYVKSYINNDNAPELWNSGSINVQLLGNFSYVVNTKENFADRNDRDHAIVQISELGLFDHDHNMIAYAQFPPVEYRSDTQHASFNLIVHSNNVTPAASS